MKKKFLLSFMLMCISIFALGMLNVSAYTGTKYGDYLYYTESNGEIEISDCDESATEVVIPEEINKKTVTSIGDSAFYNCSNLTSATIPDSIMNIGNSAFRYCTGLIDVTIGSGITSIGKYAFDWCNIENLYITDLKAYLNCTYGNSSSNPMLHSPTLYINGKIATKVEIPEGVTQIPAYAFYNCTSLTDVTIGNDVTSIGEYAFSKCTSITKTTIGDGVTGIGSYAFQFCTSLAEVHLGKGIKIIDDCAFSYCKNIEKLHISDLESYLNCNYSDGYGEPSNPMYYSPALYINGKRATKIEIPSGVTKIPDYAFYGCSGLTSITFPERDCDTIGLNQ